MHADIGHLEYYNRAINTVKRFLYRRSLRRSSLRIFPHVFAQKGHKHSRTIPRTLSD